MKRVKLGIAIVFAILFVGFMSCAHATFLPNTEKVFITGTEVKRLEPSQQDSVVRDRRYILAKRASDGEPVSFLNEDTRWGWPFYLKFDSADLSAQASDIVRSQPDAVILVKFYGMRSAILDEFPNVVSMRVVDKDYVNIPVFNILFYLVVLGVFVGIYVVYRKFRGRKKAAETPPPAAA